ncbi:MAG TPA: pilus assembly protein N-terminal domain-containing protein [Beijerinckiaceae bacterium]|nr:pilus assembly protein N-terminal domain-containing protein [Beijerinckiaceae bacterium]
MTCQAGLRTKGGQRRLALGALLACAVAVSAPALANDTIDVQMDSAKLLKMPEGADTIVIGNPMIADVSLQRNNVLVVTGKQFGTTNLIALDRAGAIISESRVVVMSPQKDRLVVYRGLQQETYSCNPDCGAVTQIGDAEAHFGRSRSQSTDRLQAIRSSSGN